MPIHLTAQQCRLIGALIEKEITTPEQYPLTLNGLTIACNQKSNREPVMSLTETAVQIVLDELSAKHLISEQNSHHSRVVKYKHRFCNTEFGNLQLSQQQLAIICVLLLRGPQTPGELRTRTNRLADFSSVTQVEAVLQQLAADGDDKMVQKLAREPGKRESRYRHLFSDLTELVASSATAMTIEQEVDSQLRLETLEQQVEVLTQQVTELKAQLQRLCQ